MTDGLGSITWWGFTPSLDLQSKEVCGDLEKLATDGDNVENLPEMNILLVGAGDLRHLLLTAAQRYKHPQRILNFYIIENSLELVCRAMLQLSIALEPLHRLGLQEKVELFLELYGNILVRQQCMDYVVKMSTDFIKMVTDSDYLNKRLSIVDLSALKFKERDFLEQVFKIWRDAENRRSFYGPQCWDLRLRKNLGVRYDAVPNVFDWDCSITLKDRGAAIIHPRQYSRWRHKGVAFELREASYDVSNRTLASGHVFLTPSGDRTARLGYWGDLVCSPYLAFGIQSENESLFKKSNNQYMAGAEQVSEYNLLALFSQLSFQKPYEPAPPTPAQSTPVDKPNTTTITEIKEVDEDEEDAEVCKQEKEKETEEAEVENQTLDLNSVQDKIEESIKSKVESVEIYDLDSLPNTRIHFLSPTALTDLPKKAKFQEYFHLAYFASSMLHHLKPTASSPSLSQVLTDEARLVIESPLFMVEVKKEQIELFNSNSTELMKNFGCNLVKSVEPLKDPHLFFQFNRTKS